MFKIDINLDDETENENFINTHKTSSGRILANRLQIKGKGSSKLATSLSGYAWNKYTAINLRKEGNIQRAKEYEDIADRIYKNDISPVCICW